MSAAKQPAAPQDLAGNDSVDAAELARFQRIARGWWNPEGQFRPLHKLNPVRLGFMRREIGRAFDLEPARLDPLAGLDLLDIGCGGGLIAEPMARLGARVTGLDAEPDTIGVARAHADELGLTIDYRVGTAEALAAGGPRHDVVSALEIIEHVPPAARGGFMDALAALVRPGGLLFMSTLNRTPKGFLLGVAAPEYLLRWLPRGTHDWRKFVRPSELAAELRRRGFVIQALSGLVFDPLSGCFHEQTDDLDVNYILCARRQSD